LTVVVSDTSPIRALEWIGRMGLIEHLYGQVVVPPAVRDELMQSSTRCRPIDVSVFPFIEVREPTGAVRLPADSDLDTGESEALSLAIELQADTVLIDELAGRSMARRLGFKRVGTLGILLKAKTQGLVNEVGPLIDELRHGLGFFVRDALVTEVLKRAGESE